MYCPNCGAESTVGLKYCKRCGGNLTGTTQLIAPVIQPPRVTGAIWAVAIASIAVGCGGLGIVFGVASSLVGTDGAGDLPRIMVIMGASAVFGIIWLLIRALLKLMSISQGVASQTQLSQVSQAMGSQYNPAQIPAPPSVMPSVTEHTTRSFDQRAYDERRARE
ncbi:MAG TPA: zinc ribbon domain-containing protein [Blastocatellia bacterium]|nr:zinc ribbon domain-containing protein [Blastocatellia bacterium]